MRKLILTAGAALVALAPVAPAAAVTSVFVLSGTGGSAASYTFNASTGLTLVADALNYTGVYNAGQLMTLGTITNPLATTVFQADAVTSPVGSATLGGIGVRTGNEGAQQVQVDTTGVNEILTLTTSKRSRLAGATFNFVDADDTLAIFGKNGNTLTWLGYTGEFNVGGAASVSGGNAPLGVASYTFGVGSNGSAATLGGSGNGDNRTWVVNFAPTALSYEAFYFTSNSNENDGYRLASVSFNAVPEPATWAMLMLGFGMVGFAARGRRRNFAAA